MALDGDIELIRSKAARWWPKPRPSQEAASWRPRSSAKPARRCRANCWRVHHGARLRALPGSTVRAVAALRLEGPPEPRPPATPAIRPAASARGADLRRATPRCLRSERKVSGLHRARTDKGEIRAGAVYLTPPGRGPARWRAMLGVALPVTRRPLQMSVSEATAPLRRTCAAQRRQAVDDEAGATSGERPDRRLARAIAFDGAHRPGCGSARRSIEGNLAVSVSRRSAGGVAAPVARSGPRSSRRVRTASA